MKRSSVVRPQTSQASGPCLVPTTTVSLYNPHTQCTLKAAHNKCPGHKSSSLVTGISHS